MAPGSRRVLVGFLNNRTYALLCGKRQKGDHDPLSRATRKRRRGHPRARRRRAHGGACGRHHERARAAEPAVARIITSTDKLFVAALNGPAAGVGLAWALACDIVLASERAVLVPAFGRLGLVPEVGTSWLLTRRLGYHGAIAYYLRGRHIGAEDALELGLVEEVHPHDELLAAAEKWCERAERLPAHALEMTKPLLRAACDASWEESLRLEEFAEANCFSTAALGEAAQGLFAENTT
jgi:2-(1,2-epoxy-1,2-dihydrophenyl)acetyl-CoA isomerase